MRVGKIGRYGAGAQPKVVRHDLAATANRRCALNRVRQLADVPGPRLTDQQRQRLRSNRPWRAKMATRLVYEEKDQLGYVLAALPKWWQVYSSHVDSVHQVF